MTELAALKKQRSANKGRLTNIINFAKAADEDTSIEDCRTRLARVEQLMAEFTAIENKIFSVDSKEESDYSYEENYYIATTKLNTLIRSMTIAAGNSQSEVTLNASHSGHTSEIKLPKINIPPFSGEYTEWQSFFDLFSSTIHESTTLSPVQKFQYLKGLLRGEAAVLLRHISITESNYIGALNKLKERYDRKRHITNSFIRTFIEQPSISTATASNIKQLMDTSDEVIRGLKALGDSAEARDHWLIFLLVQKLDDKSKILWAENVTDLENPKFSNFLDFLSRRIDALESANMTIRKSNNSKQKINSHIATKESKFVCAICKGQDHSLFACKQFNEMDVTKRRDWAKENNRCFNCLSTRHQIYQCASNRRCLHCKKKHHSLLHIVDVPQSTENSNQPAEIASLSTYCSQPTTNLTILPTAIINILNSSGSISVCRALLDSGSQASFITEACVQRLGLKRENERISVAGLGSNSAGTTKGLVTITARPKYHPEFSMAAFILPNITSNLPRQTIENIKFNCWPEVQLADPYFFKSAQIDILIGADYFFHLMEPGQIKISKNGPILHKTILGWVVSGRMDNSLVEGEIVSMTTTTNSLDIDLDRTLRRFWEIESIQNTKSILLPEEILCENHFSENIKRSSEGRYSVRLPFKQSPETLGNSLSTAIQRLRSIERRFARDPEFYKLYKDFMLDYQTLHHMKEVPSSGADIGYYLPHHGVIKSSSKTTKLRVVFDGSAKTSSGVSLNDCLAIGPTVQATLYAIILKFREHQFVVTADVEKMYRQIEISDEDTRYQKIVWRNHPSEPIRHFCLTTVTYGLSSASFLATRVLKQIAEDNQKLFPPAAHAISHNIYVDDLMTGADNESELIRLKDNINMLLSQHGFNLRKWMSNSKAILEAQAHNYIESDVKTITDSLQEELTSIKVLGLNWNPATDRFTFTSDLPDDTSFTKRKVVSEASRIFDPLGWLAPVIVVIKMFVQKLWVISQEWDELLPEEISKQWQAIRSQLAKVNLISIPRFIQTTIGTSIQLHGFSDASQRAYGAVVYLRVETATNIVFVNLISAKTKVAPLKQVSLPRLELCAAVLLTNLINTVKRETQQLISRTYAWTDSKIVLDWLSSHPRRWCTFVGNRTAEILDTLPRNHWQHVSSADNPADCASRGLLPQELNDHLLWWNGPNWLHQPIEHWPAQQKEYGFAEEENKKMFTFAATVDAPWLDELLSRYSSLTRLQRVVAYAIRFMHNTRAKRNSRKIGRYLTRQELFYALHKICEQEQRRIYSEELIKLQINSPIAKSSSLKSLNPFLDQHGLMRVGGRLENCEASFTTKHPIILPPKSLLSSLILRDIHVNNHHAGLSLTLAIARQNYWFPNARNLVRSIIAKCVTCAKFKTQINYQMMGNLPSCRVELIRPFLKIGVDYAGPISIHLRKGRGQKTYKSYICLFICLSTKAIHLELVSDMTTDAFLGALKRFVARRGICEEIYSDNGTNFHGASNQLNRIFNKLIQNSKLISDYSSRQYISWHFIPPSAPHFGGIWEAGIKSAKFHLKRVIGNTILTFEEMGTLLAEIESILNSRPICALYSTDVDALTPSYFLIGHSATKIPEIDVTHLKLSNLTRWEMVQQMAQHFWKRWHVEYLTSLQPRTKWRESRTAIKVGDIVVIKENNVAVNQWPLAKVVKLHPGSDHITRVVTVKTSFGEFKRPTNKLCILPIPQDEYAPLPDESNKDNNQPWPTTSNH